MKKIAILSLFLTTFSLAGAQESIALSDSLDARFQQQLVAFPQEKIYLQTDKSNYLSGERIWFRAHLVDALSHRPVFISRYVYVEFVNPADDLVKRIKIRPDSTGVYSGHLDLDDDLAEGAYTIRAYTNYMRNRGEEAFFRRFVQVLDPFSLQIEPLVSFDIEKNNVDASIQFIDRQTNDTVIPEFVSCKLARKASKTLTPKNNRYNWRVNLPEKEQNRSMLLGLIYKGRKYNRYYTIPYEERDFDVTFFPEGGYLVPDILCQVAFKGLNRGGLGENISGTLYDSGGSEILTFEPLHLGMGFFNFTPAAGETYYAICKNERGVVKRFDLPAPDPKANIIATRLIGNRLVIANKKGAEAATGTFSLLVHHKGLVFYHKEWNPVAELYAFPYSSLPEGILNVLLLNERQEIVSERLLFNTNSTARTFVKSSAEKPSYKRREPISMRLQLLDADSVTVLPGSIAVSITDKESVIQDTTTNIISTLLIASELKGYIESPSSYFRNGKVNKFALDALMMTQGWRRYNIADLLRGKIETPNEFEPELAQRITGKADGVFGSLKEGQISLMAKLDSLLSTETTQADEKGRFVFNVEYPEGTSILIQSKSKKGGKLNVISIDKATFPAIQGAAIPARPDVANRFQTGIDAYLQEADEDYTQKNGVRTIMLEEVVVTAQSQEKYKESSFYSPIYSTGVQTAEDIEKMGINSLRSLLYRTSGIIIRNDRVTTTRSEMPVLFVIDNMNYEDFSDRLDDIDISSIESIFVVRDNTSMPGYYPNTSGAVVITTKIGGYKGAPRRPPNIDGIIPLGYQQPAEFYSPKYETPEQKDSSVSDLRTTILWNPNVRFPAQGEAVIDFYSADRPTTYRVIGEGVSDAGKLIRFTREITVESSSVR